MALKVSKSPDKFEISSESKNYEKRDLLRDWNSRSINDFPLHWGIIDSPEGVVFLYCGDISFKTTRSFVVKDNMSVEVSKLL